MSLEAHVLLLHQELLAGSDADLELDEVEAGHELGDRVLDLDARVDLDEVEVAVAREQELDRAGVVVVGGARDLHGRVADLLAQVGGDRGRGRFLDQLLVAALDRAVALAQVQHLAVLVGQDLHLDVARVLDERLQVHGAVAERGLRLALRGVIAGDQAGLVARDAHAATAAAGGRLDHDRIADRLRDHDGLALVLDRAVRAGDDRYAGRMRQRARRDLVAQLGDGLGLGADEGDLARAADLGEMLVLGQETVPRMDRVGVGDLGRGDDRGDVEVALRALRRPDADRLVGLPQVDRIGVGRRVHGHGLDAELPAGADHALRDLAAVGDQDAAEHQPVLTPVSTRNSG